MSDAPSRLLDDSPRGVSARLLGAARRETAPASSRLRALQVASASAGLTAAGAIGAARVVRGVAFRAWMGVLGVVVVALGVAVVLVTRNGAGTHVSTSSASTQSSSTSATTESTTEPPRSNEAPAVDPPTIAANAPAEPVASNVAVANEKLAASPKLDAPTTSTPPTAAPTSNASSSASPPMTLAEEIATLDAAKHALAGGDPAGAIAVLDRYGKDVPKPHLAPEAMELRIEALHALGRDDEACALSKHFLELYPSSPLSARARSACPE